MREKGAQNASGRYGRSLAKPFPYLPSNREFIAGNKTFVNMEDWLVYSGQDKNSIFADPKLIVMLLDMGLTPTITRATARFSGGTMDALTLRRLVGRLKVFLSV